MYELLSLLKIPFLNFFTAKLYRSSSNLMSHDRLYDVKVDFEHLVKQKKSLVQNEYEMLKRLGDDVQEPNEHGFSDVINYSEDGKLYATSCSETANVNEGFVRCFVLVTPSARLKWSQILELHQGSFDKFEILKHLLQMVSEFNSLYILCFQKEYLWSLFDSFRFKF